VNSKNLIAVVNIIYQKRLKT